MTSAARMGMVLAVLALGGGVQAATNVVPNGGFEAASSEDQRRPAQWDLPDGLGVVWTAIPPDSVSGPDAAPAGHAMRIDTRVSEKDMVAQWRKMEIDKWDIPGATGGAVAGTYGLSYYSDAIPVSSGQAYRVSFDYLGPSGGAKVWVRGYGMFRNERRRRYETIVNCRVEGAQWTHFSQVFHPTRLRPRVDEMKVMLYAYWPPGLYWFDNVAIEPVSDAEYEAGR